MKFNVDMLALCATAIDSINKQNGDKAVRLILAYELLRQTSAPPTVPPRMPRHKVQRQDNDRVKARKNAFKACSAPQLAKTHSLWLNKIITEARAVVKLEAQNENPKPG